MRFNSAFKGLIPSDLVKRLTVTQKLRNYAATYM
jgi:hypothetical protein